MTEQEMEQRKQAILNDESKFQRACGRLVERGVIYCVSSLMWDIGQNLELACKVHDIDYDEALGWFEREDYNEPVEEFIRNDADLDELEWIADECGYWSDVLESIGYDTTEPPQKAVCTDDVCVDCHMELQGCGYEDLSEERRDEIEADTAEFSKGHTYLGSEHDTEFSRGRCACCSSSMAGSRFGYSDGETEDIDLEDWLKLPENEGKEAALREAVIALITNDEEYREVADNFDIEPERHEIYEHWLCCRDFANLLESVGETVFDFCDFTIWGRTTTGQSISMDYCIKQIVKGLPNDHWVWHD